MDRTLISIPVVLAAAFSLLPVPTVAGPARSTLAKPPVSAAKPSHATLLTEQTPIPVTLMSDLKLGANKVGEDVSLEVSQNIYDRKHSLLVPAGTPVLGTVTQSEWRGYWGKAGKIDFTCDYILMPGNNHIPLRATPLRQTASGQADGSVGVITALAASSRSLIDEHDGMIHHGAQFTIYVDQDTPVSMQKGSSDIAQEAGIAPLIATAPHKRLPSLPCRATLVVLGGIVCTGKIIDFDGVTYKVITAYGEQEIDASTVQSISVK